MRVLHVIPSIGPVRGGPSEAALAMTRALRARGIEADIVTTTDNGADTLPVTTGKFLDYNGARVCFLPRWSPRLGALREFQFAPGFPQWFSAHLAGYDGLHVHAIFSYLSTRAMQMARQVRRPFIARPLGQLDAWSLHQKMFKKQLYFALLEKSNLLQARAIHCTSTAERASVLDLLPGARVAVIPHGVTPPASVPEAATKLRERYGIAPDERLLLFLSRWHPKKNIPLLLQALGTLQKLRWRLVLAGTATDGHETVVRQTIQDGRLGAKVICPGHVEGEDKATLLQGADLFILPSASENFGIAVAEALACGLPVVVTSGVDLAPAVTMLGGGEVCEPNIPSLSSAIEKALATSYDREQLRRTATTFFSWEENAAKLASLYTDVFASQT